MSNVTQPIAAGEVLSGSLFSEPMRVVTVAPVNSDTWELGLVGTQTNVFRSVPLSRAEIERLKVERATCSYEGDCDLLRLGLQAYSLGIAYEFDPYFGLSISRVDPLPHQLEAVYDYLLKLARVRFLLADDAGAGKTIMAGLLLRELKLRGLGQRTLIVCPANLSFQWQRELREKFDEQFIFREDQRIARLQEDVDRGVEGAAGNLRQAEMRQAELMERRNRRREELERQRSLTLQGIERLTSVLVLPHPEREKPEVRNLRPDPETEAIAMRVAIEYERSQGRVVADVHEKNLGYDITTFDANSGELRLIEVKGLAGDEGVVALTPNEKRTAEDRRDCYWLYVVTGCKKSTGPKLMPVADPAQLEWDEVRKIDHYALKVAALDSARQ